MALEWKKVYVFISSTFNDMHAERDYLVKRVFPDLREWCEQRKLRLIDIDLRWGITEADAASKKALKVCLQRINDCRPFFVCFLGQRHGWTPVKDAISPDTFQEFPDLEQELQNHPTASITELEIRHAVFRPMKWRHPETKQEKVYDPAEHAFFYLRDNGYLASLSDSPRQLLTIYSDEVGPDDETPEEEARRLRSLQALSELRREIESPPPTPLTTIRYSVDWREDLQTPELIMPLDCPHGDEQNVASWRRTWNRFVHLGLGDEDISIPEPMRPAAAAYNAALTKGRLSNFRCAHPARDRFEEETELADLMKHDLQGAILLRYSDRKEVEETSDLQKELDQHEEFIASSVEGFVRRAGDFDELNEYVESDSRQLLVLTAPGGMGKSTLLGKWVDQYRNRDTVYARFIGQSDASSTVHSLMRFLLREIKEVHQKLDAEIPEDSNDLRRAWPELLKTIGLRGKCVIVIDALNQLQTGLTDLIWLPRPLPENIKMIVSFKVDDHQSLQTREQMKSEMHVLVSEVKPFTERQDREALVDRYLEQYWKDLDPQLLDALIGSPGAGNPLYLKVVLSELRVFGAFANLSEKIHNDFGDTPVSAFETVLQRLENDPSYSAINPNDAVPLIFGLLAHARHGLSVDELTGTLVQAMKLPGHQKSRQAVADTVHLFFRQVHSFLGRREGRYDYFYESFRIAATKRYVAKSEGDSISKRHSDEWHRILGVFFLSQAYAVRDGDWVGPLPRGLRELLFHLQSASRWDDILVCLRDPRIFNHLWPGVYGVGYHHGVYGDIDPTPLDPGLLNNLSPGDQSEIGYAIADAFGERARDLIRKTMSFQKPWPQTADWLRHNSEQGFAEYRDTFYSFIRLAERTAKFALVAVEQSPEGRDKLRNFLKKNKDVDAFLGYLEKFGSSETGLSHALEDDAYPGYSAWEKLGKAVL